LLAGDSCQSVEKGKKMRGLLTALAKFVILTAFFGPVLALLIIAAPIVGSGSILMIIPIILLLLLALLALGSVAYLTVKGISKASKVLGESALPRSVARSVAESRHHGRLIMRAAQQYPPGPMRDRLNLTLKPVEQWLENLNRLEQGLTKLYSQCHLDRELRRTQFEIEELRRQSLSALGQEAASLRDLLDSKKQHLATLKELQTFRFQAELKVRKIASDLACTHTEMLLVVAKGDFNDNRFRRLDENLQEHMASLRDMLAAMDELGYSNAVS
jgi:hypothetical protein